MLEPSHVGPLTGDDDIPARCDYCGKPGIVYVTLDNNCTTAFCKRHANRLFVKLGKLLGYVD